MSLADKVERLDFDLIQSPPVGKMLSESITCHRETIHERKSQLMQQTLVLSYFK